MAEKINDGGNAFPTIETEYDQSRNEYNGNVFSHGGLSIRDWFAGMAMQGFIHTGKNVNHGVYEHTVAEFSYIQADAMLKARDNSNA